MTYRPRATCKRCRVTRAAAGGLSRSGLCGPCGEEKLAQALVQLSERTGPVWAAYRAGLTDYVAGLWGDTVPPHPPDVQGDLFAQLEELIT